jgi:S1-C subfamily serine protease
VVAAGILLLLPFSAGSGAAEGVPPPAAANGRVKSGTGFYVSPRGFLLTSRHVVAGCPGVAVWPEEGGEHQAHVVAADKQLDLAVLSVNGRTPDYAALRDGARLKPGQSVLTIAFGILPTEPQKALLTSGRFVKSDVMPPREQILIVRAELRPGNSGSPVVDASGSLVGMVIGRLADRPDLGVLITSAEIDRFLLRAGLGPLSREAPNSPARNPNALLARISALVQCTENCRNYTMFAFPPKGTPQALGSGKACKGGDGTWRAVAG